MRKRRHDDDESLEPHAEVDEERKNEEPRWISSPALSEERERKDHVAGVENRRGPPPLSPDAIREERLLELAARVPRHEPLAHVCAANNQRCEQRELRRCVEVVDRDVML